MNRFVTTVVLSLLAVLTLSGPALAQTDPEFKLGFKALADQIPDIAGQPIENERYGPNGDSLQQTTTGLMAWRKAENWTAFTDGATTWINGPEGVQSRDNDARFPWEADSSRSTMALAPKPAPAAASTDAAPFDTAVEDTALAMINAGRPQFGEGPLAMDERLRQVARAHAKDMGDRNYFAHTTPDGKSPSDRMAAAGIKFGRAAENIGNAGGYSDLDSVKAIYGGMMAELPPNDDHRVNILNGQLKKVGIGVYRTPDGRVLFVCDFTD
jgi:uncharacterized protein YkwD